MRLLIDGVFFQLSGGGIARVWSSLLPRLAQIDELELLLLDRGNAPTFSGVQTVSYPSYKMNAGTAADSILLEKICQDKRADVFTSTYYTTPLTIPSMLLVYDMIPEVLGFDLNQRPWLEKDLAVAFANSYACISQQTKSELEQFHPHTSKNSVVAYCGVDPSVFFPHSPALIASLKTKLNISKPYYLLVGAREQHQNYKNQVLTFNAAKLLRHECELLCIGGEKFLSQSMLEGLPNNVSARRLDLNDQDLAVAYSGAEALIYPSLYEGFGMPVAEAMACGCPVITTSKGSLVEVAGDAALLVSGHDVDELKRAIIGVQDAKTRDRLRKKGIRQASQFSWDTMASVVYNQLILALREGQNPERCEFYKKWSHLRRLQAEVDPY